MKIFTLIILTTLLLFSTSCSLEIPQEISSSSVIVEETFPTPEDNIEEAFTALKSGDFDTLGELTQPEAESINGFDLSTIDLDEYDIDKEYLNEMAKEITVKLYKNLEIEITDSWVEGDSAKINATMTTVDGGEVVNILLEEAAALYAKSLFSGDLDTKTSMVSIFDSLKETLDSSKLKLKETETTFNMIKGEDNWIIQTDENFYDDITGGTITASKELISMMEKFI